MAFPPGQLHRQRLANKPATQADELGMLLQTRFHYPKHSKKKKKRTKMPSFDGSAAYRAAISSQLQCGQDHSF
jgi:hypothetical protein